MQAPYRKPTGASEGAVCPALAYETPVSRSGGAALESMKGRSSAGADGMPVELYQQFPSGFVPRMCAAMECFLGRGYHMHGRRP